MSNKESKIYTNDDICLRTIDLRKTYISGHERIEVLRGVDIVVRRGEIISVIGASGTGKTTLLNLIGTLDRPTGGMVLYDGRNIFELTDNELARFRNRDLGFIFQFHHLLPEFSAVENVMMPALISGMKRSEARKISAELLELVGLKGKEEQRPYELSGGEQQRVAVARALVNKPRIVLADEPTGNLDRKTSESVHDLICKLNKELKQTFIIATHNESLAKRSDRILKIFDGKIEEVVNFD